ncbi:hypothetical protein ACA910_013157 [Epithemia clementina (nom. ined.)]
MIPKSIALEASNGGGGIVTGSAISEVLEEVTSSQLASLNDTDGFVTAWQDVLQEAKDSGSNKIRWGGRGQGGRGRARRTFQPHDVVVDNISLVYAGSTMAASKVLLEDAQLKLLSPAPLRDSKDVAEPSIYALVGRNGSGKSTLLKRMHDGSIAGFPPHISTLYLPQELVVDDDITAVEYLRAQIGEQTIVNRKTMKHTIQTLEDAMEALDLTQPEDQEEMERLNDRIASCEEELEMQVQEQSQMDGRISEALEFMGVLPNYAHHLDSPLSTLSPGIRKKVILASALLCPSDLLLLDEPTSHLDMIGLIRLRRLLLEQTVTETRATTVLLVSHDLDLVNQVATHIVELRDQRLFFYKGNYAIFTKQKRQESLHQIRHDLAVVKKKTAILDSMQHLKEQNPSRRKGGVKKKQRQIDSQKRKLERLDQQEKTNNVLPGASTLSTTNPIKKTQELLQKADQGATSDLAPDKKVQFNFRNPKSEWGQPLILAYEVGFAPDVDVLAKDGDEQYQQQSIEVKPFEITKKPGFLFDLVELCVDEGSRYCILGANGSGKSLFLRLLTKQEKPTEGEIQHATNVDIALIHQELADGMVEAGLRDGAIDAISFLSLLYPNKTEQELRGELSNFGIGPSQATTNLRFLSGGERARLSFAANMLRDPQVLLLDNPTLNLDAESVEALVYGLSHWKGTLVFISHDTHFIRALDPTCYILMEQEGKLRRVDGSVDTYLRSFASLKRL